MKNFRTILLAGALTISGTALAQFANTGNGSSASNELKGYNRIGISYNNTHLGANKQAGGDKNSVSLNGFGIDYIHGFSLTQSCPLFLELGINANFNFGSKSYKASDFNWEDYLDPEDYEDLFDDYEDSFGGSSMKTKYQDINLQIPVNFGYRFNVAENFSIAPYVGLNFKLHIISKKCDEFEDNAGDANDDYYDDYYDDYDMDSESSQKSEWKNLFSDSAKDMGSKDATWNRFQMGWHVGAGFQYKPLYLGIQYGTDFIPAYSHKKSKVNSGNLKITLAYCF